MYVTRVTPDYFVAKQHPWTFEERRVLEREKEGDQEGACVE